jgi:isoleucyl-tRNA synthetase
MRWIFSSQIPENNLLFGYKLADETRRHFHLMLWNVYNFFITYANIDNFNPDTKFSEKHLSTLDRWLNIRLSQTIKTVSVSLDKFDAQKATEAITQYVNDLSLWYVRRSRDRVGPSVDESNDKQACHHTLYTNLVTLSQLLAPFMPFISESMYRNLTSLESVHLSNWPKEKTINKDDSNLIIQMELIRKLVEMGLSGRKNLQLKVRQPLKKAIIKNPNPSPGVELELLLLSELNVKKIEWQIAKDLAVELDSLLDSELLAEGQARELIRQIQDLRKQLGTKIDQYINITAPLPSNPTLIEQIKKQTLAKKAVSGPETKIELV